jgi:hypothetical protein
MPTKEENQEGKYYIESWFQVVLRPHHNILQQFLAPSPSEPGPSCSGISQSIFFKLEYEYTCNSVMHMAPLEIFLHLKRNLSFFK